MYLPSAFGSTSEPSAGLRQPSRVNCTWLAGVNAAAAPAVAAVIVGASAAINETAVNTTSESHPLGRLGRSPEPCPVRCFPSHVEPKTDFSPITHPPRDLGVAGFTTGSP